MSLTAADIHATISWPEILERLGVAPEYLRNRHGPCPMCGGKDRFRFDDRGRGTWICNQCGAGDGFSLVGSFYGLDFNAARRMVIEAAGLAENAGASPTHVREATRREPPKVASPSPRVRRLLSTTAMPDTVTDAIDYLSSRSLWPLPDRCRLRAHAAADYWHDGERIGRYSALIGRVADVDGELVTAHVTYLENGHKLERFSPRKLLGPVTGRRGCCVRLMPAAGETLGIAEGIETALAAHQLHGLPVWAALNTSLLARWVPPPGVYRVVIFADRDVAGLEAALKLTAELDGRVSVETRTPKAPARDWADTLEAER